MKLLDFNVQSSQIDSTDIFIFNRGIYHHLGRYCKFSPKVNQRISYARIKCIGKMH